MQEINYVKHEAHLVGADIGGYRISSQTQELNLLWDEPVFHTERIENFGLIGKSVGQWEIKPSSVIIVILGLD